MCVCYAGAGPGVGLLGVPSTITTITIYRCDLYGERCHHTVGVRSTITLCGQRFVTLRC